MRQAITTISILFIAASTTVAVHAIGDPAPGIAPPADEAYPLLGGTSLQPPDPPGSELTLRGRDVRGVYLPLGRLVTESVPHLVGWVEKTGATAVIIDMKDDFGRVTFTDTLPLAQGSPHGFVPSLQKLVPALKANGIYVIGRIVCFKDKHLPRVKPAAAIRDRRTNKAWRDRAGVTWLDPYSEAARDYVASVAVAAARLGIDEVQLDYVRFPVDPESRYAKFAARRDDTPRYGAIAALLAEVDSRIALPLSIDVFGLTAYNDADEDGLGQYLEHLAPYIDAISPMLYLANWPQRVWENATPSRIQGLIYHAVRRIRARLGDAIAVRPLLQAFSYRAEDFGPAFIDLQIEAARSSGSQGHLFWNQSGRYGAVESVWRAENEGAKILAKAP